MFLDWLGQEGWIIFNWWLLVTVAGMTVLPLLMRLAPGLPDRGYTLARGAGVLLITFTFWLLASLGFLNNSSGSVAASWLIVLILSWGVWFRLRQSSAFDLRAWWHENRALVVIAELIFIALLLGWSTVRAYQNGLDATEKMMDLAFMSAVQRSETFPPNDPWLSGYSISYYYFGYVMGATLSKLSGVWSTTGFNMHIAMLFALTGLGAFGVGYNLVRAQTRLSGGKTFSAFSVGLLAVIFINLLGNLHTPLVELPYRSGTASEAYLRFWDAKDRDTLGGRTTAQDLLSPEDASQTYWWWFAASRTITERDLNGVRVNEVIDEFPQFSFLLADSHPHVMALPYVLLAIGLALSVLLNERPPNAAQIVVFGVCVGGLVFLNTWDSPIYISLIVAAEGLRRLLKAGHLTLLDWAELIGLGLILLAITFIAYFPFLAGFRSQLGGILPNLLHPTRFQQLFVMFGPFFLILTFFLVLETWQARRESRLGLRSGLMTAFGILGVLVVLMGALVIGARLNPTTFASVQQYVQQNGGWGAVTEALILRRVMRVLTLVVLLTGITLVVAQLFPHYSKKKRADGLTAAQESHLSPSTGFALVLVGVGTLLILIPEFVYLRDNFGTRMNTVFKFYYQAWITFALASAYAVYAILGKSKRPASRPNQVMQLAFIPLLGIVLVGGLLYPALGIYHRTHLEGGSAGESGQTPTLDGGQSVVVRRNGIEDYQALMCLHDVVQGDDAVVAEATEPSYDFGGAGRTGALTGIPTVIGWYGHQAQWRGTGYGDAVGTRVSDIENLYSAMTLDSVLPIIEQYGIDYVLYGPVERQYYGAGGEDKFAQAYNIICDFGTTRIYLVTPSTASEINSTGGAG